MMFFEMFHEKSQGMVKAIYKWVLTTVGVAAHTACTGFQTEKKLTASNLVFQAFEGFIGT